MMRLGEISPALHALQRRLGAIHSDDMPAALVRLLYGIPENSVVTSRRGEVAA